ncbi:hypothetical protein FDECE_4508 [Fusarium decemcellulare]|nr:hypothetical protein FDECE_4508 [Fusarium decemcellulare]
MLAILSPPGERRYLVRFDQRDTGLSTEFPVPGGYSIADMAGDVEGLADHLGLSSKGFHLVGASMGGPIAYLVAGRRPKQVRSLTLLYASPGANEDLPLKQGVDVGHAPLPGGLSWEREGHIEHTLKLYKALTTQPVDDDESSEMEKLAQQIVDRDIKGRTIFSKGPNHGSATFTARPGREVLKDVKCPTTVIQAAKDQYFGVAHGETLAREIEGAEYVLWDDVGHELPKRIWSRVAETFLKTWKKGDDEWSDKTS